MLKKAWFWTLLLVSVACQGPVEETSQPTAEATVAVAEAIHQRVITIDTHDDIPLNFATPEVDPGVRANRQVDLPKMREGGLDVAFFAVYVGQTQRTPENYEKAKTEAMTKLEAIHRMAEVMYPGQIEIARSPDDVERIHRSGKLAACIGIENGYAIGKDSSLIQKYYDLGARYMTLTHGGHNDIGDSSTPREELGDAEAEHNGLSEFGRSVVQEMNRLGMLIDVSHVSKKTMMDVVAASKAPIIASHSAVRALCDHPRNVDDEQLMALKANGGVLQTVAVGSFLENPPEKQKAMEALFAEFGVQGYSGISTLTEDKQKAFEARRAELDEKWPPATIQDLVDHIDYAVRLIGIDHVGIGTDFDGGGGVNGWNDASETPNLTIELVRRGYTEEEIGKLWGGNLLRAWRQADRVAEEVRGATE